MSPYRSPAFVAPAPKPTLAPRKPVSRYNPEAFLLIALFEIAFTIGYVLLN